MLLLQILFETMEPVGRRRAKKCGRSVAGDRRHVEFDGRKPAVETRFSLTVSDGFVKRTYGVTDPIEIRRQKNEMLAFC